MDEQNVLCWSPCLLAWSDFKAEPNSIDFEDAYSFIKYSYTWTLISENFGNEIKFAIQNITLHSEFHKHLSWVRIPLATDQLLHHQQGHFDLAELIRLEITPKLKNILEHKWYPTRGQNDEQRKQFAREDSEMLLAKEMEKWDEYLLEKQQIYDMETNYGQAREKQSDYDARFTQLRN